MTPSLMGFVPPWTAICVFGLLVVLPKLMADTIDYECLQSKLAALSTCPTIPLPGWPDDPRIPGKVSELIYDCSSFDTSQRRLALLFPDTYIFRQIKYFSFPVIALMRLVVDITYVAPDAWLAAPLADLPDALVPGAVANHTWLASPQVLGTMAAQDALQDLTGLVQNDHKLDWYDYYPFYRSFSAQYGSNVFGIPMSGAMFVMHVRRDVMQSSQLPMPRTWLELVQFSAAVNGTDMNGDGVTDAAICLLPDFTRFLITSIWASLTQTLGTKQGLFYDVETMEVLANTTTFARALELYQQLYAFMDMSDVANVYSARFADGQCAVTFGFTAQFKRNSYGYSCAPNTFLFGSGVTGPSCAGVNKPRYVRGRVITAPLPGSEVVLDRGSGTLVPCTPSACPYATLTPTQNGSLALVNFAPYNTLLSTAAVTVAISKRASIQLAFFSYYYHTFLCRAYGNTRMLLDPLSDFGPTRVSQLDEAIMMVKYHRSWSSAGYEASDVATMLTTANWALLHNNLATDLRLPNGLLYSDVLLEAANAVTVANLSVAAAMGRLAANCSLLLPQTREELASLQEQYWVSIAYKPVIAQASPAPPSDTSSPPVVGIVVGACVPVGLLLFAGLAALVIRRRRHGHKNLWGLVMAPVAGPATTLLVTDIENSTSLWESCDASVMDVAIKLHHSIIRHLLLAHSGYETATEGDSFIVAFHTPREALRCSLHAQLKLLAAAWPPELDLMHHSRAVWLHNSVATREEDAPPRLSRFGYELGKLFGTLSTPGDLVKAGRTTFSSALCPAVPKTACVRSALAATLPVTFGGEKGDGAALHRGLRVRFGIHTGVPYEADVCVNATSGRTIFSGKPLVLARAVTDAAHGGQILFSETTHSGLWSMPTDEKPVWAMTPSVSWHAGLHVLKDDLPPLHLYSCYPLSLVARASLLPPLRSLEEILPGAIDAPFGQVAIALVSFAGAAALFTWNAAEAEHALMVFQVSCAVIARELDGFVVQLDVGEMLGIFTTCTAAVAWPLHIVNELKRHAWSDALLSHPLCEELCIEQSGASVLSHVALKQAERRDKQYWHTTTGLSTFASKFGTSLATVLRHKPTSRLSPVRTHTTLSPHPSTQLSSQLSTQLSGARRPPSQSSASSSTLPPPRPRSHGNLPLPPWSLFGGSQQQLQRSTPPMCGGPPLDGLSRRPSKAPALHSTILGLSGGGGDDEAALAAEAAAAGPAGMAGAASGIQRQQALRRGASLRIELAPGTSSASSCPQHCGRAFESLAADECVALHPPRGTLPVVRQGHMLEMQIPSPVWSERDPEDGAADASFQTGLSTPTPLLRPPPRRVCSMSTVTLCALTASLPDRPAPLLDAEASGAGAANHGMQLRKNKTVESLDSLVEAADAAARCAEAAAAPRCGVKTSPRRVISLSSLAEMRTETPVAPDSVRVRVDQLPSATAAAMLPPLPPPVRLPGGSNSSGQVTVGQDSGRSPTHGALLIATADCSIIPNECSSHSAAASALGRSSWCTTPPTSNPQPSLPSAAAAAATGGARGGAWACVPWSGQLLSPASPARHTLRRVASTSAAGARVARSQPPQQTTATPRLASGRPSFESSLSPLSASPLCVQGSFTDQPVPPTAMSLGSLGAKSPPRLHRVLPGVPLHPDFPGGSASYFHLQTSQGFMPPPLSPAASTGLLLHDSDSHATPLHHSESHAMGRFTALTPDMMGISTLAPDARSASVAVPPTSVRAAARSRYVAAVSSTLSRPFASGKLAQGAAAAAPSSVHSSGTHVTSLPSCAALAPHNRSRGISRTRSPATSSNGSVSSPRSFMVYVEPIGSPTSRRDMSCSGGTACPCSHRHHLTALPTAVTPESSPGTPVKRLVSIIGPHTQHSLQLMLQPSLGALKLGSLGFTKALIGAAAFERASDASSPGSPSAAANATTFQTVHPAANGEGGSTINTPTSAAPGLLYGPSTLSRAHTPSSTGRGSSIYSPVSPAYSRAVSAEPRISPPSDGSGLYLARAHTLLEPLQSPRPPPRLLLQHLAVPLSAPSPGTASVPLHRPRSLALAAPDPTLSSPLSTPPFSKVGLMVSAKRVGSGPRGEGLGSEPTLSAFLSRGGATGGGSYSDDRVIASEDALLHHAASSTSFGDRSSADATLRPSPPGLMREAAVRRRTPDMLGGGRNSRDEHIEITPARPSGEASAAPAAATAAAAVAGTDGRTSALSNALRYPSHQDAVYLRGPRIKAGVVCGDVRLEILGTTGHLVYCGTTAALARRISNAALSSQVLCSQEVSARLPMEQQRSSTPLSPELVTAQPSGKVLRSLNDKVVLHTCSFDTAAPSS